MTRVDTESTKVVDSLRYSMINHPDDDDFESEIPIGQTGTHLFMQIHDKGSYKAIEESGSSEKSLDTQALHPTIRLDVTFSVTAITAIDHEKEVFECKVRIFAFWIVDIHGLGMEDVAKRARASGHFTHMKRHEIDKFTELSPVPKFHAMNAVSMDDSDPADIRVYGGEIGETAVLWNKGYIFTCKTNFNFTNFPFDDQHLNIQLRLADLKQWDTFNLCVSTVQFHRQALRHPEWFFREPKIGRSMPKTAATDIKLQIHRHPGYYLQNIVVLLTGLVVLTLLVFALEVEDVGTRLIAVLTNVLNAVAFKLFYSTLLPKVNHNTILDYYIFENFALLALIALFSVIPFFYREDMEYANKMNYAMLALSIFLIVANISKFFITAKWRAYLQRSKEKRTADIVLDEDSIWYSYRFSRPHYLPKIDDGQADKRWDRF